MNTERTIMTRRSIRSFTDAPVEDEKLRKILLAGNAAPSAMNNQHKTLIAFVGTSGKAKLNDAVKAGVDDKTKERIESRTGGIFSFFYGAPALIVVASSDKLYPEADCACAIENMMLQATDLGLGTCWINQLTKTQIPEVLQILQKVGLEEDAVVYGALAVGYAKVEGEAKPKTNKIIVVR